MSVRLGRGSIDDSERHYFGSSPVCEDCRHRIGHHHLSCDAFPDRIPREIWNGRHDHRTPFLGDNGIRFAPMSAADKERARVVRDELIARYRQMTDDMRRQRGLPPIDWDAERSVILKKAREQESA
jgi:hypothetical protein